VDVGLWLQRLTHHFHILELNGDSYRLKQSKGRRRKTPAPEDDGAPPSEMIDPKPARSPPEKSAEKQKAPFAKGAFCFNRQHHHWPVLLRRAGRTLRRR
jgi:hypothetical protein